MFSLPKIFNLREGFYKKEQFKDKEYHFIKLIYLFLIFFLFINTYPLFSDGHWEQIRKADWEFALDNVYFSDENKGRVLIFAVVVR